MRPLTDTVPKPMLPVAGTPIAARVADAAIAAGASELLFVVGYRREAVEAYFGSEYRGVPVTYAIQEEQAGTADAVATAIEHVSGPFAVLNGDNVYDERALEALFEAVPAVGYTRVESPEEYGVLTLEDDRVTGIVEKPTEPPSNLANTGAYAFPQSARALLDVPSSERGERELTDVLSRLLADTTVTGVAFEEWADIAYPWELLEANERALAGIERRLDGAIHESASIDGPVVVEPGASVGAGVSVRGPVLLKRGASIGPNARIHGATVIGEDASIGRSATVGNSLVMDRANVRALAHVGDSIVGPGAALGSGTVTSNRNEVGTIQLPGDTSGTVTRERFGAVIGPDVETVSDTTLEPGAVLVTGTD